MELKAEHAGVHISLNRIEGKVRDKFKHGNNPFEPLGFILSFKYDSLIIEVQRASEGIMRVRIKPLRARLACHCPRASKRSVVAAQVPSRIQHL
jgi:hypothetical protein